MGCMESTAKFEDEFQIKRVKVGLGSEFEENNVVLDEEVIKVEENALLNLEDDTNALKFSTKKNDIRRPNKTEIHENASRISKEAILKLNIRKDLDVEEKNIPISGHKLSKRINSLINN